MGYLETNSVQKAFFSTRFILALDYASCRNYSQLVKNEHFSVIVYFVLFLMGWRGLV